jgi:hypothetical protein
MATVSLYVVIAGLDPAIHLERSRFAKAMDARVKPRMTGCYFIPQNSVGVLPVTCRNACEKAGTLA